MDFIYGVSGHVIVFTVLFLMLGGAAVGVVYGRRRASAAGAGEGRLVIVSAELAMLGLLLAFTFSAASARFDARRDLVVLEATDLQSCFLRAQTLPEPAQSRLQRLLREYVEVRLAFFYAGQDPVRLGQAQRRTAELQDRIWDVTIAETRRDPSSAAASAVLDALEETFGMSEKRAAALRSRVPSVVVALLLVVSVLSLTSLGYTIGLSKERHLMSLVTLTVLVASVLYVILDLDRPREGMIRVSQQSLHNLRDSMDRHLKPE